MGNKQLLHAHQRVTLCIVSRIGRDAEHASSSNLSYKVIFTQGEGGCQSEAKVHSWGVYAFPSRKRLS